MDMEKKQIYIAGKITGLDITETRDKFRIAALDLWSEGDVYIINPCEEVTDPKSWLHAMQILIPKLIYSHEVYMLHDWYRSRGARIEWVIAKMLGIPVRYQTRELYSASALLVSVAFVGFILTVMALVVMQVIA